MTKNYYFDMDGVLVQYDRSAYEGQNPRWLRPGEHYFRNLEPDRKMLQLIDRLWRKARYTGDSVSTLTSLTIKGAIFNEHLHDKILWQGDWIPYLGIENILVSVTSKRDAVEYINNHKLTKADILIDDFNKNLVEWRAAGGTAVKYCNGLNTPESFAGPRIHHNDSLDSMIITLESLGAA